MSRGTSVIDSFSAGELCVAAVVPSLQSLIRRLQGWSPGCFESFGSSATGAGCHLKLRMCLSEPNIRARTRWDQFQRKISDSTSAVQLRAIFVWLVGQADDTLVEMTRHAQRAREDLRRNVSIPEESWLHSAAFCDGARSPGSLANLSELIQRLRILVNELPADDQRLLRQQMIADLSDKDLAAELSVSARTVRRRTAKILDALRSRLGDHDRERER